MSKSPLTAPGDGFKDVKHEKGPESAIRADPGYGDLPNHVLICNTSRVPECGKMKVIIASASSILNARAEQRHDVRRLNPERNDGDGLGCPAGRRK